MSRSRQQIANRNPPASLTMWAIVICNPRSQWVLPLSIRATRRDAWKTAMEALYSEEYQYKFAAERRAKRYRAIKVTVAPQED